MHKVYSQPILLSKGNVKTSARLQWRYAPVSDLFVVYQENYLPGSFGSKNRALILKLSYWFNV